MKQRHRGGSGGRGGCNNRTDPRTVKARAQLLLCPCNKHHSLKLSKPLPCNLFFVILKEIIYFFYVFPQLIREQKVYLFTSRI